MVLSVTNSFRIQDINATLGSGYFPRRDWYNSARIVLLEVAYIPADIHLFSRRRRNCDLPSQGWRGRAYHRICSRQMSAYTPSMEIRDVLEQLPCLTASSPSLARARKHVAMQLSPCHRIACAKSAPQVIGRCLTTLSAPTAVGDTEGGISAILLALSSFKHLKWFADMHIYSRHRRNCDRRKQGRILFPTNSAFPTSL